ncbi:MAG: asparagine synthase (glutamine-hydrolyzing) [Bacteroidales bacterium]
MCGLAGFISSNMGLSEKDLKAMISTISHRGPDSEGVFISDDEDFRVGIGFRRLAIIDLSDAGNQPMYYKNLVLTLNGEIYNYREIREELKEAGYSFSSGSDTEVAIKAFHLWGVEMASRFIGMFAFAVYNRETKEFFLIRDRLGIKPLYYYEKGGNIIYASELKPVMACHGVDKSLDYESLSSFLYHGYITGSSSIFRYVKKVEPGTYVRFVNGQPQASRYWDLKEHFLQNKEQLITDEAECLSRLDALITDSVRYRMIADVPIGSFLSGGIDSSLTTAVMQKLSPEPVNTFTIGFDDKRYNEATEAAMVSKYLGTRHFELILPVEKARDLITDIPNYFDEPFGDSSALPTMLVSGLAKKNATVVLSGDGGDELFCGYNNYASAARMKKLMPAGKILNLLTGRPDLAKALFSLNPRFARYPYLNSNINIINVNYIVSKYFLGDVLGSREYSLNNAYFKNRDLSGNLEELYMLNDMTTYLPDDILTKVDRASMSVSLEARVPILDHRLVEFSFRIPHQLKNRNGTRKYLLKELAYRYVPREILDRPKHGFAVPVFSWLKGDLKWLREKYLSGAYLKKQDLFNPAAIVKLDTMFEKSGNNIPEGNYIWNLIMFQLWFEKYLE